MTERKWTARLLVAGATLALLGAACGGNSSPSSGGGGASNAGGTTASTGTTGTTGNNGGGGGGYNYGGGYGGGGGGGSNGGGGGGGGTTTTGGGGSSAAAASVTVQQVNYSFSPSTPSVKSGGTIVVKNTTPSTPHTFTINGQNINVTVQPGKTAKIKVNLPAGTYPFYCQFHQSLGMTGTLTVG